MSVRPSSPRARSAQHGRSLLAESWGANPAERRAASPADALIPDADEHWVRAVDIAAPAELAWRWVCQLRAAPYSYDRIDNFGRRSPQELTPGLDALEVGQPLMTLFTLASFARDEHLTLRTRSRRPLDMAVAYVVSPTGAGRSRLVMHILVRLAPGARNPVGRAGLALLRVGDLVMARRQVLNLAALAERDALRQPAVP